MSPERRLDALYGGNGWIVVDWEELTLNQFVRYLIDIRTVSLLLQLQIRDSFRFLYLLSIGIERFFQILIISNAVIYLLMLRKQA